MRLGYNTFTGPLLAPLLGLLVAAGPLPGASAPARSAHHRRASSAAASTSNHKRHAAAKASKSGRKPHKPNAYQRLAKMQIDPGRVQNIQRALSDAGAYHGSPSGQWDSETRDAMSRYQTQNGFAATGLPDAKSLMKLGLGPHPLPAELDKKRAANLPPNPDGAAKPVPTDLAPSGDTLPAPASAPAPASPNPPQQ